MQRRSLHRLCDQTLLYIEHRFDLARGSLSAASLASRRPGNFNMLLSAWRTSMKTARSTPFVRASRSRRTASCRLATGWREQNVLRLEWSRIDLRRKVAWVAGTQVKAKRAIGSPLNDQAMAVLATQKGKHPRWVFPNDEGEPYDRGNNHGFKAAQRRARIAPLRWHDLRHTWASWHVMAGTSLRSLMELGGWRSYQSVLRYAHLSPEHLAIDAARLPTLATGAKSDQINWKAVGSAAIRRGEMPALQRLEMVAEDGIEPPTRGFSIPCSTN